MASVKVEVDFDDAIEQQCTELRSSYQTASSNFEDVAEWCYKLLDCYSYEDIINLLITVTDKINSTRVSFKNDFVEKIAADKITEMQEEINSLTKYTGMI